MRPCIHFSGLDPAPSLVLKDDLDHPLGNLGCGLHRENLPYDVQDGLRLLQDDEGLLRAGVPGLDLRRDGGDDGVEAAVRLLEGDVKRFVLGHLGRDALREEGLGRHDSRKRGFLGPRERGCESRRVLAEVGVRRGDVGEGRLEDVILGGRRRDRRGGGQGDWRGGFSVED